MAAYKNFIMGVEELIWAAMEKGFTDADSIYAYVYMYEPRVSTETVNQILDKLHRDEAQY